MANGWLAAQSQLYGELGRLAAEGQLTEVIDVGRSPYMITESVDAEIRSAKPLHERVLGRLGFSCRLPIAASHDRGNP
ncbi:MAG: hypothetical protein JWR32_4057 [Mycobacterium sp.]|jgi:hypothetical protein|nr:hypothetical protein [Mycobacterium sp.]